tara:strand:+ start:92 stop:820 length:729 start_codon:yes stop_codon:yes gene_type:complete
MPMIQFNYTYNIPNELCVDHTFTDGNTRTAQYDGPDKLFFIVNNATGREELGPVTEIEKNDGRPIPPDCRYVEISAFEYPELCQLRGPIIDEMEEDHTGSTIPTGCTHITGYAPFDYQTPVLPYQFLHDQLVTFDADGVPTIPVQEARDYIMGTDIGRDITWDDVRAKRNQFLKNSDSEITDDMPTELRNQWLDYRQRLRDWPTVMQNAGNSPIFAYNMEPIQVGADPTTGMIDPDTDSITM